MTSYPGVDGKSLVNRERAYDILAALNIDGLIAALPINVRYLGNTVSTLSKMLAETAGFATFARDPAKPSFLITSTGGALEASTSGHEVPEIMPFSWPATALTSYAADARDDPLHEPPAVSGRFAVAPDATFTARERIWLATQETYSGRAAPTAVWALVRALREAGMTQGTIAIDDPGVVPLLQRMGLTDVTFVPGSNVFKRIRVIKSKAEIALMRVAQANNAAAAMAAARSLEAGMTYGEFERRFAVECAARGSVAGFVLLGFTQALLPDDTVVQGKSYMLDAFSSFRGYFGDFARTVVVGEPSAEIVRRFQAQQIGRAEGFAKVKAGVPFAVVAEAARTAMVKAGMPEECCRGITLHSVGLQHNDNPHPLDLPFEVGDDLVLRENMTVTLDLPYLQLGWGAGHNEDMLLVTETGYDVLNDESDPLVIV